MDRRLCCWNTPDHDTEEGRVTVCPASPNIRGTELLILLVVILLLFGAKRVPQLARSLGAGSREFRRDASGAYD